MGRFGFRYTSIVFTIMDIGTRWVHIVSDRSFSCPPFQTDSQILFDDSDVEDDARACFPCPFCYVDIELSMLCSHLQEDHCFDLKNAVSAIFIINFYMCTQSEYPGLASN